MKTDQNDERPLTVGMFCKAIEAMRASNYDFRQVEGIGDQCIEVTLAAALATLPAQAHARAARRRWWTSRKRSRTNAKGVNLQRRGATATAFRSATSVTRRSTKTSR
jgi:hypothetical protein